MKAKLAQRGLYCSLEWVTACLEFLHQENPGDSQVQLLFRLEEQWTLTDITTPGVIERSVLPADLGTEAKVTLPHIWCALLRGSSDYEKNTDI